MSKEQDRREQGGVDSIEDRRQPINFDDFGVGESAQHIDAPLELEEDVYRNVPPVFGDVDVMAPPTSVDMRSDSFEFFPDAKSSQMPSAFSIFAGLDGVEVLESLPAEVVNAPPPTVAIEQPIPSISDCPIKCHTTVKLSKDCQPEFITDKVQELLESNGVECSLLQKGLKLKGSVGSGDYDDPSGPPDGSFLFVFQLFWSDDKGSLIGVFRRLCGDIIAYNNHFRKVTEALAQTELQRYLL